MRMFEAFKFSPWYEDSNHLTRSDKKKHSALGCVPAVCGNTEYSFINTAHDSGCCLQNRNQKSWNCLRNYASRTCFKGLLRKNNCPTLKFRKQNRSLCVSKDRWASEPMFGTYASSHGLSDLPWNKELVLKKIDILDTLGFYHHE